MIRILAVAAVVALVFLTDGGDFSHASFLVSANDETTTETTCSVENNEQGTCSSGATTTTTTPCSLYATDMDKAYKGVYAGMDIARGEIVVGGGGGEQEELVVLPLIDFDEPLWREKYLPISHHVPIKHPRFGLLESNYSTDALIPGVFSFVACHNTRFNVQVSVSHPIDQATAAAAATTTLPSRSDPSVGSYSYGYHNHHIVNYTLVALQDIPQGHELLVKCTGVERNAKGYRAIPKTLEFLHEKGTCLAGLGQRLQTKPSTVGNHQNNNIGRGAFATVSFQKGDVVTESPVLLLDRHDLRIAQPHYQQAKHVWKGSTNVDNDPNNNNKKNEKERFQLLLNYCFGHEDSDILLFPYRGGGINLINHHHHDERANVLVQWSNPHHPALQTDPTKLLWGKQQETTTTRSLSIQLVATQEIKPGDEILLDYGKDWHQAWQRHVDGWKPELSSSSYTSAAQLLATTTTTDFLSSFHDKDDNEAQQQQQEYPENIMTVCHVHDGTYKPCRILHTTTTGDSVTVILPSGGGGVGSSVAGKENDDGEEETQMEISPNRVWIVDRPYSSDMHLKDAFRHAIGVPDDFFPLAWRRRQQRRHDEEQGKDNDDDEQPSCSFAQTKTVSPGTIRQVLWKQDQKPVSQYCFEVGLDESVGHTLLEYANRIGVTSVFRRLLVDGYPLPPGNKTRVALAGQNWLIDRPQKEWGSNMHWISPHDESSHEEFLRALGVAGFDKTLASIGQRFGLDGLLAYHVTFIGVSHCHDGMIHSDFVNVNGKAFNLIIPLILANQTGPELVLEQDDEKKGRVGFYQYQYGVGAMVGDSMMHGTAACDYRPTKEMRVAATVYLADVNTQNVQTLVKSFTQVYPPPDMTHLLEMRGKHWSPSDPTKRLPGPLPLNDPIQPNTRRIHPVSWRGRQWVIPNLYHVVLPRDLVPSLCGFLEESGIDRLLRTAILGGKSPFPPDDDGIVDLGKDGRWKLGGSAVLESDLRTLSVADEGSFYRVLRLLGGRGGFDQVLKAIGAAAPHLQTLTVYSASFFAVHKFAPKKAVRWSAEPLGDKAYQIVIPLHLVPEVGPEYMVFVQDPPNQNRAYLKLNLGYGLAVGDKVGTSMVPHDYKVLGDVMIGLRLRVADIDQDVLSALLWTIRGPFPPRDRTELLTKFRGRHWNKTDASVQLPTTSTNHDEYDEELAESRRSWLSYFSNLLS